MYSEIFNLINTKTELDTLIYEVGILHDSFFKLGENSFENVLKTKIRTNVAQAIESSLAKTKLEKQIFLKGLKEETNKFEEISVTLGYQPRDESYLKMGEWVKNNLGEKIVLEISYDPILIAGAIVVCKGKYIDLSLKTTLKQYFENHKSTIQELLNIKEQ